jgi:serine/threonine protein phosphatase PrpC
MPLLLRCPFCDEPLAMEPDTLFCEACGGALAEPVTGEEPALAAARSCLSCGGTEFDQEGYCVNCGDLQPQARDRMEVDLDVVVGISDKGLRHHRNEDSMALRPAVSPDGVDTVVAVVCDGVSTSERPDEASAAAVSAAARFLLAAVASGADAVEATRAAVRAANEAVADTARDSDHGNPPACTIVTALVGAEVTVGWLGDSRAYWLNERGSSKQLTLDDAENGSHAISAWLGADSGEPEPHVVQYAPGGPGTVLVCSDGLWNYVEAAEDLAALTLPLALTDPHAAAARLVQTALDGGGHDNITVVVVPCPVRAAPGAAPAAGADAGTAETAGTGTTAADIANAATIAITLNPLNPVNPVDQESETP